MIFIQEHLDFLLRIQLSEKCEIGEKLRPWAASINLDTSSVERIPTEVLDQLPATGLDRTELRDFCKNAECEVAFLAIAAWGGMKRPHGALAWNARSKWKAVLDDLRTSIHARPMDYHKLQTLRQEGRLPGVGIPYFTKLLFFLRPKPDAYIMDQWTAKSVNLLTGRQIVNVNAYDWVLDNNDANIYAEFCDIIDQLAGYLNCDGGSAEHALNLRGGNKPSAWRQYVETHYPRKRWSTVKKKKPYIAEANSG